MPWRWNINITVTELNWSSLIIASKLSPLASERASWLISGTYTRIIITVHLWLVVIEPWPTISHFRSSYTSVTHKSYSLRQRQSKWTHNNNAIHQRRSARPFKYSFKSGRRLIRADLLGVFVLSASSVCVAFALFIIFAWSLILHRARNWFHLPRIRPPRAFRFRCVARRPLAAINGRTDRWTADTGPAMRGDDL